jgi:hypothetical protein
MQMPTVPHLVKVGKRNITITIWAYRKLDENEVARYSAAFAQGHRLKRGCKYDAFTTVE